MSTSTGLIQHSAIYQGWVRHRRYQPARHQFRYRVFMMYLDLDELPALFAGSRWWSVGKANLARFQRSDFLGDPAVPLKTAVQQLVLKETGEQLDGPVRMLANLRYFGYIMNPICCYYCFDQQQRLRYIVAEVNNTPWDERHQYVLPCDPNTKQQRMTFPKQFHVSPFMAMDMDYHWRCAIPGQQLFLHMENQQQERRLFDATLLLERHPINAVALDRLLLKYPLMTAKVVLAIYWQALKLAIKRVPFFSHPKTVEPEVKSS